MNLGHREGFPSVHRLLQEKQKASVSTAEAPRGKVGASVLGMHSSTSERPRSQRRPQRGTKEPVRSREDAWKMTWGIFHERIRARMTRESANQAAKMQSKKEKPFRSSTKNLPTLENHAPTLLHLVAQKNEKRMRTLTLKQKPQAEALKKSTGNKKPDSFFLPCFSTSSTRRNQGIKTIATDPPPSPSAPASSRSWAVCFPRILLLRDSRESR